MKKYIYVLRDKGLRAYSNPQYSTEAPDVTKELVARGLQKGQVKNYDEAKDQALYYLGTFDDIEGKFELVTPADKLLDYEDYLPRREDMKNGRVIEGQEAKN